MPKKETLTSLNKSKLLKLLSKLEPQTVKTFKAWYKQMGTPTRDAFLILEYILLYYPNFDSPKLQQDIAFKKVFGKIPFDYRKLMKTVSQIHLDLKQYLVNTMVAEDESLNNFLLAKVYTKYDLPHERQLLIDKQLPPKITPSHPDEFFNILQWEDLAYFSESITSKKQDNLGIIRAMAALDWYYLGQKLKYACEISTRQKLFNLEYTINFESTIAQFSQHNFHDLPLFHKAYFAAWQLIKKPTVKNYSQLKNTYTANYTQYESEDQLYLLTHLINHTISEIRKNAKNAIVESFELYQFGIDQQIFVIDTFFVDTHFMNLIAISTTLKKFDWIDTILTKELAQLAKSYAPSIYNLSMAGLNFAKKDFLNCIVHLIEIDHNVFLHSCKARVYQIACDLELKEPNHIIESHCKSFENYLRRNPEKYPVIVQTHLNFIFIIRQLIKFAPSHFKIHKSFKGLSSIAFRPWLQDKINSLN